MGNVITHHLYIGALRHDSCFKLSGYASSSLQMHPYSMNVLYPKVCKLFVAIRRNCCALRIKIVIISEDTTGIHSKCRFHEAFDKCKETSHWEITSTIIK